MPLPMKTAAKRLGKRLAPSGRGAAGSPQTRMDSSQGNAMVTPTPRKKVRREIMEVRVLFRIKSVSGNVRVLTRVQELRAGHNASHQAPEPVAVASQLRAHLLNQQL